MPREPFRLQERESATDYLEGYRDALNTTIGNLQEIVEMIEVILVAKKTENLRKQEESEHEDHRGDEENQTE